MKNNVFISEAIKQIDLILKSFFEAVKQKALFKKNSIIENHFFLLNLKMLK